MAAEVHERLGGTASYRCSSDGLITSFVDKCCERLVRQAGAGSRAHFPTEPQVTNNLNAQ
jgi:hypothetical protein